MSNDYQFGMGTPRREKGKKSNGANGLKTDCSNQGCQKKMDQEGRSRKELREGDKIVQ